MSLRRLDAEGADLARAAVPLALLLAAAVLPWLAGAVLVALAVGTAVAAGRRAPVVWAWAAGVPAAALLAAQAFGWSIAAWDVAACADAGPAVAWAVGEALAVAGISAVLVLALGALPSDIGLRTPPRYALRWAASGATVLLAGGLAAVVLLSGPLLDRSLALDGISFVVPAVAWAIAVAVAEEVAWRGVLQGWLSRTAGAAPALVAQAVLYGVAWGVAAAAVLPGAVVGVLAGLAAAILGALVLRTRTLWVGVAWHAAFNVPLFVLLACTG